ncbi:CoA-binding protein [Comamonas sp. GB3 AK4-5]|uniref:CoA-binding protein n=1 Tax=Comamonas sp. GB3 AK4-5 TaxID=3231487 RepID=UPI00351E757F
MPHTANASDSALHALLQPPCNVIVVGLSPQADRPSHEVAEYLQRHGLRVIPVNPVVAAEGVKILGEQVYASVSEAAASLTAQGLTVDIVDCFRKSEAIPPIAQEAIAVGAHCLWLQQGVVNEPAAALAAQAGLLVMQDACIKIEHRRLVSPP